MVILLHLSDFYFYVGNFDCLPDIVNEVFGGAEGFCITLNIFGLCSEMQLNYLETITSFRTWSLRFIRLV